MLARDAIEGAHGLGAAVSEMLANAFVSSAITVAVLGVTLQTADVHGPLSGLLLVLLWPSLGFVVVTGLALARRTYVIGAVARTLGGLPLVGRRLRADPLRMRLMEDAIFDVLRDRPRTLAQILLLELLAQGVLVFQIYWAVSSMGVTISTGGALLSEVLTKVANLVQFLGVAEGGYAVVFSWLGMGAAVGVTLSLVKRVCSLVTAVVGLAVLRHFDRLSRAAARRRDGAAVLT
jgi:hypothetical protein